MKTKLKHSGEIDVTETARRCGFKMRVVLSRRLWDFIEGPPDACRDEAETLRATRPVTEDGESGIAVRTRRQFRSSSSDAESDFRVCAAALLTMTTNSTWP